MHTYREQGYRLLPLVKTLDDVQLDTAEIYERLGWQSPSHFLLESGKMGDYSFVGGHPFATLTAKNGEAVWTTKDGDEETLSGNPLHILRDKMALFRAPKIPGLPKFRGGAVGFLSYDMIRYFEKMPRASRDDLGTPDLCFLLVDRLCVIDHAAGRVHLVAHLDLAADDLVSEQQRVESELERMAERLLNRASRVAGEARTASAHLKTDQLLHGQSQVVEIPNTGTQSEHLDVSFSEAGFVEAVLQVQEYIRSGDVFQVNLSVRQGRELSAAPYDIYRELRRINPSPYASYLHFPDMQIVSSSPELLVRSLDGEVDTRPIAGTRPRTGDEARDRRSLDDLRTNEKEIAEHIMLVDLERNDLGRVCRYGSVHVSELMAIEEYSHVFHIVSNVRGQLADGKDVYDLIEATFPGGTITGAPKIRTMEIIEELEPTRRGLYTGSIGWIDFDGDMELNIVIRTLQVQDGKGYVQAGAGIVIDSVPEREYKESLRKAKALWVAIEAAEANKRAAQREEVPST
jgi:para-aminobenzoate synthetase component I